MRLHFLFRIHFLALNTWTHTTYEGQSECSDTSPVTSVIRINIQVFRFSTLIYCRHISNLTLLHSERPKLCGVLVILSATGFKVALVTNDRISTLTIFLSGRVDTLDNGILKQPA